LEVDSDAFAMMMNSGCKERRWILDRHGIRIAGAKRLRAAAKNWTNDSLDCVQKPFNCPVAGEVSETVKISLTAC
jgi:hypothetical protein